MSVNTTKGVIKDVPLQKHNKVVIAISCVSAFWNSHCFGALWCVDN